jgi:CysZ protein
MIGSALLAFGDLLSRDFRSVLAKAIGLTLGLFVAVLILAEVLISRLSQLPWPWADTVLAIGSGVALVIAFFFLMAPVAVLFAGLYLDQVAAVVEAKHYPGDPPGSPLTTYQSIITAMQFAAIALIVNIAVLPLVFFAVGAVVLIVANAYLISREFFEMAATRHMPIVEARQLRKENTPQILVAGLLPALLTLVPVLHLVVPLFSTAYFVHLFKKVAASSA